MDIRTERKESEYPSINYDAKWLLREQHERSHITDVLRTIRKDFAIEGQSIVELGSGIGTNLAVFSPGNSVLGVEGLDAAVVESRRRGIETIQANLDHLIELEPESADWVLCLDVLEHLANPMICLQGANATLRNEGGLIINVPNHFDWRGRLKILKGSGIDSQAYFPDSPHWAYPHLRFFSRESIEGLLQAAGFRVETDFASRFLSFPKQHLWRSLGLQQAMHSIQKRWPDLFCHGFYLLCRKA